MERVLAIVPALNEARSVADVVAALREITLPDGRGVDVVVVDDGSTDATGAVARAAGARVLTLPFNLGVGGAMRTGYRFAAAEGYTVAVQVDADGQHDPAELGVIVGGLADADVVIGARFAGRGSYRASFARRTAMRVLAWDLARRAGTDLTDVTSGFRAAGPRAIALWSRDYPVEYLGDTVESLVTALRAGLTVTQVPVEMRPRAAGNPSQGTLKSIVYLLRALLVLVIAGMRRPVQVEQP